MAYLSYDSTQITVPDKVFRDKAFVIAISPKYDGRERTIALVAYKFFDKKFGFGAATLGVSAITLNQCSMFLVNVYGLFL